MFRKPGNTGFTLIELLVVISIIALLSSVVMSSLGSARAKSRYSQAVSQMRQIKIAADLYYSQYGSYPPDTSPGMMPAGLSQYLSAWPTPPCSTYSYDWNYFSSGANVHVDMYNGGGFYCIYANTGTTCGSGTFDITTQASKQLSC